jgi:hypothetical protein
MPGYLRTGLSIYSGRGIARAGALRFHLSESFLPTDIIGFSIVR